MPDTKSIPSGYEQMKSGLLVPTTIKADALSDLRNPTAWLLEWSRGGTTLSGVGVSHSSAMTLAAYYACIRAISEDVGKVPLITYRRLHPRGKERAYDHPMYELLHDFPNDEMESMTFRETLQAHALAWGNGYAEIERGGRGEARGFHVIHPSRVLIRRDDNGRIVYDVFGAEMISGSQQTTIHRLRSENVFHLRGLGSEGLYGYSVLNMARQSLGLSLAAEQFGAAFFGNGAHIGGVIEHPQTLSDIAMSHLRDSWKDMYGGPSNAGKPAILEEGMKWAPISIPPEQAQYLQTRTHQVREVARWFRMPLHKIQDMADASYNNIEHQSLDYLTDTMMPWFIRWEQQIKRKLFKDDEKYLAEHLYIALLRADAKTRSSYYRTMIGMAALSPNEIREAENMNPIGPAGDTYFFMANNLLPIDQVVKQSKTETNDASQTHNNEDEVDDRDEPEEEEFIPRQPHRPASLNGVVHHDES